MAAPKPRFRKDLSLPGLLNTVFQSFNAIPDPRRQASIDYTLTDTLRSAFAMFSLKYPSLLSFEHDNKIDPIVQHNLSALYGVQQVPSDSQMRSIVDSVDPAELRPTFRALHSALQRGRVLDDFLSFDGRYLLSIDGTGLFSSSRVSCPHCCIKKRRQGEDEFYHQLLAAVIVHPDRKTVLPIDFEPITRADGNNKNDCERNAAKRLAGSIAKAYPKRQFIVLEDALAANGPHIALLKQHHMDFLIVAKPGGNATLFDTVHQRQNSEELEQWESGEQDNGAAHGYRFTHRLPLNLSHPDSQVNYLEYWEVDAKGKERIWSWITSLEITHDNALEIARAARARWKIENETFNTLKNQGYHLEHNYGHGKQYLSSTLAGLMLLAFLVDQIQQQACRVFQRALENYESRRKLWERLRAPFFTIYLSDWGSYLTAWACRTGFNTPPDPVNST